MSELELAMNNSYDILTGKNTFDELIKDDQIWLAHDPRKDIKDVNLDILIEYFEKIEDYEKCAVLKNMEK